MDKRTKMRCYTVNYRLPNTDHETTGSMVVRADNEDNAKLKVIEKYNDLYELIADPGEGAVLPTFTSVELMNIDDDADEVEFDLYAEGRARGFELICEHLLGDDVPEPVFAGILDEIAQFLVEINLTDEFRGTLAHIEELLNGETEKG